MRFIMRSLILLLIVNVLLFYMHYKETGSAFTFGDLNPKYMQEIKVTNRSDALHVQHHFTELPEDRYELIWPEKSTNRSCVQDESSNCSRLNEEATAFLEGEEESQVLTYTIPKDKPLNPVSFFENIFVKLDGLESKRTLFHMTDEMKIGGLWVNGLELVGSQKMNAIDYSFYRGVNSPTNLYWFEKEEPLLFQGNRLEVFGEPNSELSLPEIDTQLEKVQSPYTTLILSDVETPIHAKQLVILNPNQSNEVKERLLVSGASSRFSFPKEYSSIAEVVASLIVGESLGTDKSRAMYKAIGQNLSEREQKDLVELLQNYEEDIIDGKALDRMIEETTGFASSFFELNEKNSRYQPFMLEDPREVYLSGEEKPEIKILLKDGKRFYPIIPILKALSYDISSNAQSLYIENEERKFRFPMKELFYVYNEQRYNLKSLPFFKYNDEFYFEEAAMLRIFLIMIDKTDDEINLSPMTTFKRNEDS